MDLTRSARHERPAFLRSPPLPVSSKRTALVLRCASGPRIADPSSSPRYGHAGDPWKLQPLSGRR